MNVSLDEVEIENGVARCRITDRYKLKCYGSCLVVPYMVLAGMGDSGVSFWR